MRGVERWAVGGEGCQDRGNAGLADFRSRTPPIFHSVVDKSGESIGRLTFTIYTALGVQSAAIFPICLRKTYVRYWLLYTSHLKVYAD